MAWTSGDHETAADAWTSLPDVTIFLLGLAMGVGAFVQSSIGFGLAVVAAPFVVLAAPELMPAAILVATGLLPIGQLVTVERDIDWRSLGWALGGRLLLTPVGVALVAWMSARAISALVGVLVLVSVLVAIRAPVLPHPGRVPSFVAGAIAGVSGTAASIGGPFFALVLQGQEPSRVRSTLAAFFAVGSAMAMIGLAIGGSLHRDQLMAGLLWVPFVAAGVLAAIPARRRLDRDRLRHWVFAFCVVASVSVIARAALG